MVISIEAHQALIKGVKLEAYVIAIGFFLLIGLALGGSLGIYYTQTQNINKIQSLEKLEANLHKKQQRLYILERKLKRNYLKGS